MIARRLIVALLMSLVGSALFTFWLSHKFVGKAKVEPPKTQQYVALSKGLEAGEVLTAANVKLISWPSTSPLEGAFVKPEQVVGRTLLYPIAEGEPVLDRQLSAPGAGVGLAYKIPDGMRAISLRSDQVVGVAGFLLPGTHVDVLVTMRNGGASPVTSTVLQDVQIIAAGQKVQPDADGKATTTDVVTLLVSPADAEKAVEASAQGTVHFLLRNGADHHISTATTPLPDPADLNPMNIAPRMKSVIDMTSSLAGIGARRPSPPADAQKAEKPYQVQMVYGNKETEK